MNWTRTLTGTALAAVFGIGLSAGLSASAQEGPGMDGPGMMAGGPGGGPMFNFGTFDTNKDGKVTKDEVDAVRKASVASADANNDGKLSADEIAAIEIARMTARANDRAARMIVEMDTDGDGMLSVSELIVRPAPGRMFDRMDSDGDGAVTQAEADAFREQMQGMMQGRGENRRGGKGHGHKGGWFGGGDDDSN